ncbi:MAG: hypothetical protein RL228_747 [Actinomycetota bacterium]
MLLFAVSACSSQAAEPVKVQSLADLSHIHSVATDGQNIYVASHHGLYVLKDNEWKLRGEDFDIMGLAFTDGVFYASGHPGPLQNLPDPVGVLVSNDLGKTWETLSLTGEVDFHLLEAAKGNFIGAAANLGAILKSTDGGINWANVPVPQFIDMTLNPEAENEILLATKDGLKLSKDFAKTFEKVGSISNSTKVEWSQDYVFVSNSNNLFRGSDPTRTFEKIDYKFKGISDINSEKNVIVVMDKEGVHASFDSGESFSLIASLK